MKFLTQLKIGTRLRSAFALVLALTLALGAFAFSGLARVNDATRDLATNWLVATRDLGDYQAGLATIRRGEALQLLAVGDPAAQNRLDSGKARAEKAWKAYEATIDSAAERQLADAIGDAQRNYFASQARLLALAAAGPAQQEAARNFYRNESRAAFERLGEALDKDVQFQVDHGNAAYDDSQASYARTRLAVVVSALLALAAGAFLAWIITRSITAPIARAVAVAEQVAAGDLSVVIEARGRDETSQLLAALARMNQSLVTIVSQVRNSSDSIGTGSAQIATGNADLSQRTEEQASNLQQTAASMEQIMSTVKQNADTAVQATRLAASASESASQGGQVVGRVVATMEQISHASRKIADIIGVIDGIAFQTNILALNAAVEAARAGEQGRGFAVVASEVRNLAQRSAQAAREIKSLIGDSVDKVESGSHLVNEAGTSMQGIVSQVQRLSVLMGEISAASAEQTSGIGQVGHAVSQLDVVTQQNAALVEESAAAAESLRHQAVGLAQAVSRFRLQAGAA